MQSENCWLESDGKSPIRLTVILDTELSARILCVPLFHCDGEKQRQKLPKRHKYFGHFRLTSLLVQIQLFCILFLEIQYFCID